MSLHLEIIDLKYNDECIRLVYAPQDAVLIQRGSKQDLRRHRFDDQRYLSLAEHPELAELHDGDAWNLNAIAALLYEPEIVVECGSCHMEIINGACQCEDDYRTAPTEEIPLDDDEALSA